MKLREKNGRIQLEGRIKVSMIESDMVAVVAFRLANGKRLPKTRKGLLELTMRAVESVGCNGIVRIGIKYRRHAVAAKRVVAEIIPELDVFVPSNN